MDYGGIMDGQPIVRHVASPDDKIKALAAAVVLLSNAMTPHGSEYEIDKVLDAVGLGRLST